LPLLLSGCFRQQKEQYVIIKDKKVIVEVADKEMEIIRGLSNREKISESEGMLFIFPDSRIRDFWMREMKFNLDIIWIENDQIVKIDENLPTEGKYPEKSYSSITPVDRVLELNAGWTEKNNLQVGDKIIYSL